MSINSEYKTYGLEWQKEMMKFDKKSLVNLYAEQCKKAQELEGQNQFLSSENSKLMERNTRLRDIIGEKH